MHSKVMRALAFGAALAAPNALAQYPAHPATASDINATDLSARG